MICLTGHIASQNTIIKEQSNDSRVSNIYQRPRCGTTRPGGDSISQGDDHIRNIKKSIKNTFPNVSEPVTATAEELNKVTDFAATGNGVFASCKTTAVVRYS